MTRRRPHELAVLGRHTHEVTGECMQSAGNVGGTAAGGVRRPATRITDDERTLIAEGMPVQESCDRHQVAIPTDQQRLATTGSDSYRSHRTIDIGPALHRPADQSRHHVPQHTPPPTLHNKRDSSDADLDARSEQKAAVNNTVHAEAKDAEIQHRGKRVTRRDRLHHGKLRRREPFK